MTQNRPSTNKTRPSAAQRAALLNLAAGRPIGAHIRGRSESGGFSGTIVSLHRRGWIDRNGDLTAAGREALL